MTAPSKGRRYPNLAGIDPEFWPMPIAPLSMERIPLEREQRTARKNRAGTHWWCLTCQTMIEENLTLLCGRCSADFKPVARRRSRYATATSIQVPTTVLTAIQEHYPAFGRDLLRLTHDYAMAKDPTTAVEALLTSASAIEEALRELPNPAVRSPS